MCPRRKAHVESVRAFQHLPIMMHPVANMFGVVSTLCRPSAFGSNCSNSAFRPEKQPTFQLGNRVVTGSANETSCDELRSRSQRSLPWRYM